MAAVTVVGGINIDIEGRPYRSLIPADSNPGKVSVSAGGVGRNIVENIARLGGDAAMIALTGDDAMGRDAKNRLANLGVDVSGIINVPGENTGMYLSILNDRNDMELAVCNMDILERMTPEFLEERMDILSASQITGVDCNLQAGALEYLTGRLHTPLFLDPVSASKAARVKPFIGRFHTIKPNRIEAELLSGIRITDEHSLAEAGTWFLRQGVRRVFITLGEKGAYYRTAEEEGIIGTCPVKIRSATGAGDAFSAAILLGHVKGMSAEETARMGIACASLAMEAQTPVNPELSHCHKPQSLYRCRWQIPRNGP